VVQIGVIRRKRHRLIVHYASGGGKRKGCVQGKGKSASGTDNHTSPFRTALQDRKSGVSFDAPMGKTAAQKVGNRFGKSFLLLVPLLIRRGCGNREGTLIIGRRKGAGGRRRRTVPLKEHLNPCSRKTQLHFSPCKGRKPKFGKMKGALSRTGWGRRGILLARRDVSISTEPRRADGLEMGRGVRCDSLGEEGRGEGGQGKMGD